MIPRFENYRALARSALAATIFLISVISSNAEDSSKCAIWTTEEPSFLESDRPRFYEYSVDWRRLPSKLSWNAESQKFPLDLSTEIFRATSSMALLSTNEMHLYMIWIEPLPLPDNLTTNEASKHQWFSVFGFSSDKTGELRSVVSLFGDTEYASETPEFGKMREVLTGNFFGGSIPATRPSKKIKEGSGPPLSDKLQSSDFKVPKVQWDPVSDRFPLDIDTELHRARKTLLSASFTVDAPLKLHSILIYQYRPDAAIEQNGLKTIDNLHHWAVWFIFHDNSYNEFEVLTLLDGSILGAEPIDAAY